LETRQCAPRSEDSRLEQPTTIKKENAGEITKRSRRQPFDRNPGRDRVGLDLNVLILYPFPAFALRDREAANREVINLAVDSSRLPFVSLQVPGYERGFDWSDLYRRLLRVMDEPLIDRRSATANCSSLGPFPGRCHASLAHQSSREQSEE
jgi:hypothetical protein